MFYKKTSKIIASLVILIFLSTGVGCSNNTSAKFTENPQQTTQTVSQNVEQTVYITNTGKKYHRAGCKYLSKSEIPIEKSVAISEGCTTCSVCTPIV